MNACHGWRLGLAGLSLGLFLGSAALAQEPTPAGTLPPVEVRPEAQPGTVVPPENVDSPFGPEGSPFDQPGVADMNLPSAFPSLREQSIGGSPTDFGGLNSAFRSEKSLFEMSQLGSVVGGQEIREKMAQDMFHALQQEVGVLMQATGRGQASPFLRGLTGQDVLVLVDGIRMNNTVMRAGPNQYFNTVDIGQVDRIEVIRGSGSSLWGSDAIGGVINIVTRSPDPTRGDYISPQLNSLFSTADMAPYVRGNFEAWKGNAGIFGGASYFDVQDLDIGGGRGRQPFTGYNQYAADFKYNRVLTDDVIMTVAVQHFEQLNLPRSDRFLPFVLGPAPNGNAPTQRPTFFDSQMRDLAYVRFQGLAYNTNAMFDAYSLTFSYSLTREETTETRFNNNTIAAIPTRRTEGVFDNDQYGITLSASKDNGDFGKLVYGGEYYYEDVDASRVRRSDPTNPNSPTIPDPDGPQYPDDSIADRVGAFLNWDVNLTQRLNLNAGVRYDNINISATPVLTGNPAGPFPFDRSYQDFIGSAGLGYELTEELRLVGGVYEGFRAPTLDDLTSNKTALQNVQVGPVLGNLAIQPQHSTTYEVGFKYSADRLRFQVFEWWTDFDNYIGREIINNTEFLANQEAYLNGTEATIEYLLTDRWTAYGNFAYTYGQITTNGDAVTRIPPTQGIGGVKWRSEDRRTYFDFFTWLVNEQDRYNQFNLGDVRFIPGGTPAYYTLNMRAGTALGPNQNHLVSVGLMNITDQFYRVLGSGVNGEGINALFGYQYTR